MKLENSLIVILAFGIIFLFFVVTAMLHSKKVLNWFKEKDEIIIWIIGSLIILVLLLRGLGVII